MCQQIPLSQGKFALVSDCDFERVNQYKWSLDGTGYATRQVTLVAADGTKRRHKILMHRFILNAAEGVEVDHRFDNRLDNRRSEIRIATRSQNSANKGPKRTSTSGCKGVRYCKRSRGWVAEICVNGSKRRLGTFGDKFSAGRAYDVAALAAWGEFAYLNFPEYRSHYLISLSIQKVHAVPTIARRFAS